MLKVDFLEKVKQWLEQYWESDGINVDIANALVNSIPKLIGEVKRLKGIIEEANRIHEEELNPDMTEYLKELERLGFE